MASHDSELLTYGFEHGNIFRMTGKSGNYFSDKGTAQEIEIAYYI